MAYNPDEDIASKHYKRRFATKKEIETMEAKAAEDSVATDTEEEEGAAKEKKLDSGKGTLKNQEEAGNSAHWKTKNLHDQPKKTSSASRLKLGAVRHGSAYAFVVGVVLLGVWFSSLFAPNILIVNIKEMFTNDLADATIALYTYNQKMLDHKIGKADCSKKDSIKCKLSTMSRSDVKRFEKAGFTINGQKVQEDNLDDKDSGNDRPESRYKVTSIEFPHDGGTATNGKQFEENTNKSLNMKALVYSVFNPKSSFFMDERYKQRINWRYDLTKEPTITGETEEDVDTSFNDSMQGNNEIMDDTGGGNYSLEGLKGSVGTDGLSAVGKRLSSLTNSYAGTQCAYYTQFRVAANAMKKAKTVTVARFAMQYLKMADQIKAGLASEVPANVLSSKLAWSSDGSYSKKNATDGSLYRNILFGEKARNESGTAYTLDSFGSYGYLGTPWYSTVYITQRAVKGLAGISDGTLSIPGVDGGNSGRDFCLEAQKDSSKTASKPSNCPALTVASSPAPMAPAVAPYAALSARICPQFPLGVWMMYPTTKMTVETVMPYIVSTVTDAVTSYVEKSVDNFTADTKGLNASEAIFAGTGEILGDMAMSRGMRPGNAQSMKEYLSYKDDVMQEFEEIARYNAKGSPFDLTNQYSFLANLLRPVSASYLKNESPLLSIISGAFSLIPTSLSTLDPSASAFYYIQPREFDASRLTCNDPEYASIGIKADVLCNVRYSMNTQELNANPNNVLQYMLKPHPNETNKNISELQARLLVTDKGADTQDRADVQRQLDQARQGNSAPMIDEKTGKPMKHSEYEKFMTYCVNREDPWGRRGMAVRREGLSDEEKEKRFENRTSNGDALDKSVNNGNPHEMKIADDGKSAYMAISEGAEADQDWYTGKKCLENSEMLRNFRAYTMMCSVDGSHSGGLDCTDMDRADIYFDGFYNNNDIIYTSWW